MSILFFFYDFLPQLLRVDHAFSSFLQYSRRAGGRVVELLHNLLMFNNTTVPACTASPIRFLSLS